MGRNGKWMVYAQHECLHLVGPVLTRDYIIPAMNEPVCPKCGQPCDLNYRDTWARVVRRKVSDAVWFMPWTWRSFHWEYKEMGHLEEDGYNYRTALRFGKQKEEA